MSTLHLRELRERTIDDFVEVFLPDEGKFLVVCETLTRIGIGSNKTRKLYQTCHLLHKKGKYYVTHFKEMFKLDGKCDTIPYDDIKRRNTIASLLESWELIEIVDKDVVSDKYPISEIKIIPFKQKNQWELISKYNIGSF